MLRVGLTGGIACGKTTVARMFERRGARIAFADEIAKETIRPGGVAYDDVVRHFGREILQGTGEIDRLILASKAFGTPSRIDELNHIIHPAVIARQNQWMEDVGRKNPHAVAIVEAALIYEAGAAKDFDKIVVVTCREEQKPERFAARHGISIEDARVEVERRSRAQLSDAEKTSRADYVIDNSGPEPETEREVARIWQEWKNLP
jgi:dephospho-CoA kinase